MRKKNELENIRKEKLQGIMIRSKVKWAEEGEKPTRYFCGLESRNYVNKTIPKIEKEDGSIIRNQQEILSEVKKFYSDLYNCHDREHNTNNMEILGNLQNHTILEENEKMNLEGEITEEEISITLKKMKNDKSPGSDGFSAEFFKFFFKDLKVYIKRAINEGYYTGKFSVTQRQGLITCLPKGDKPRQFLKNWRPITLLNVIYKIASGCIAQRLKQCLPKLISSEQTGFISGRYIGENTRMIYDIMNFTEEENLPGLLLIIDFEKAFDSISWEFIREVLGFFNFGESIKRWISVLYNDISSAVIQSGFVSEFFSISRGCRQGDPSSPYIFLLCAEVLSLMIKHNKNIKGVQIDDIEYKLSQFADDTTVILNGTELSVEETINTLNIFADMSGLKINSSKTRAVWIGCKKYSGETFNHRFKLNWNQNNFDILGIKFSCNLQTMIELNYKDKLSQIDRELKQWSKRILTPFGRITVLKTLIISKLNHLFIALPNPTAEIINALQKKFFNFIWQSRTDRVKRDILMQNYDKGGLKMVNLRHYICALKGSWIRKLITKDSKYINIFESKYTNISDLINRGTEFINKLITNNNNPFWNDVLESWIQICEKIEPVTFDDILMTNLWDNRKLKIANRHIFYKRWYENRIYFIKDLFNADGILMTYNQFIQKYNLTINFMEFFGVRRAVESYIKKSGIVIDSASFDNNLHIPFKIREILKNKSGCQAMYTILNEKNYVTKSQIKWNLIFETVTLSWTQIYSIPAKCCSNTKLHWFQYRILQRILA